MHSPVPTAGPHVLLRFALVVGLVVVVVVPQGFFRAPVPDASVPHIFAASIGPVGSDRPHQARDGWGVGISFSSTVNAQSGRSRRRNSMVSGHGHRHGSRGHGSPRSLIRPQRNAQVIRQLGEYKRIIRQALWCSCKMNDQR